MISPHALSLLEFDKLLRIIADFANSGSTEAAVAELVPLSDRREISRRQSEIGDILRLSAQGVSLGLSPFPDIGDLLLKARPEGSVLEGVELSGFMPVLELISDLAENIGYREDIPSLRQLAEGLTGFPEILRMLKKSIDSQGAILDTASATLAGIRVEIRRLESRIRKKLEDITRSEEVSVFLQDDFVTTRSGRWVIPVRMDSKGQVAGVVHDVSKSGETAFVEPIAIIGLSNELENLAAEEKAEEIRILRNISARIREHLAEMKEQFALLVYIDVLHCIARLAILLRMEIPEINESSFIQLINSRHPLLSLSFMKHGTGRQVVPLSVRLGVDDRVMVITGSNAGGKTISIKTIGLLTLMALTGMPVAADSSSSFPLISDLLIDIGDKQSIENDLSTFSAHIEHISEILKRADFNALVLLDELGTGTDPAEGAALACAVLNEIKGRGALLFATTHLMDIKGFVHRTEGMLNAAMEFDQDTLSPLFRLRVGEPGQSHAIEIARRYGLPDRVIDSAKTLLGGVKVEFDNLIKDLTEKRLYYENAVIEIDRQKSEIEGKIKTLDELTVLAKRECDAMISKAHRESSEFAVRVKRELYELLDAAKRAEKEKIKESLKILEIKKNQIDKVVAKPLTDEAGPLLMASIKKGDLVYIKSVDTDAQVVDIDRRHKRIRAKCGGVYLEIPFAGIQIEKGKSLNSGKQPVELTNDAHEGLESRINIIGLRVDDALSRIEPFLNQATLAGLSELAIIHGIGAGILMRAVKEYLHGHPLVADFRFAEQHEGGKGVTVVTLK